MFVCAWASGYMENKCDKLWLCARLTALHSYGTAGQLEAQAET